MKITPLDIHQQQFKKTRGRYDAGEVDSFLELVRAELDDALRDNAAVKEELKRTKARLAELVEHEKILKDAIISTQKVAEDIKANAHKEAEVIVAEARLNAEKLIDLAHTQVRKLTEDITELKRQRARVEADLTAILHAHLKMLEATNEQAAENQIEAEKVTLFSKK